MTFGIDEARLEAEYWVMDLSAVHHGRAVGLRLLVQDAMALGLIDGTLDKNAVYREGVYMRSRGQLSDALADVWSRLYGFSGAKALNPHLDPFTAIVLEGDGRNIKQEHVRIKIFYDKMPDEELDDRYFELFLHVELARGRVCLNEKDDDYRSPLVRTICA